MHWGRIGDPISRYLPGPWCIMEGWGSNIPMNDGPWPRHKSLGTWRLNAVSTLQKSIAPHQGLILRPPGLWAGVVSILGPPGLWAGAVGSRHSNTHGYHFIIVGFILNTHYLLCPTLYECDAWCIGGGLGIPFSTIYPAWPLTWPKPQTIGSLTLKCWKCTMEKNPPSSRIHPGAPGSLGRCCGVPSFQHPWLSPHCCCLYTQYSLFTVSHFVWVLCMMHWRWSQTIGS